MMFSPTTLETLALSLLREAIRKPGRLEGELDRAIASCRSFDVPPGAMESLALTELTDALEHDVPVRESRALQVCRILNTPQESIDHASQRGRFARQAARSRRDERLLRERDHAAERERELAVEIALEEEHEVEPYELEPEPFIRGRRANEDDPRWR